jgi:FkbM family methyltransferase
MSKIVGHRQKLMNGNLVMHISAATAFISDVFERIRVGVASRIVPEEIRTKRGAVSMKWSLKNLVRNGFRPDVVLDIGAYIGEWTEMARPLFPASRFLMVEAQPSKREVLAEVSARTGSEFEVCLLGRKDQDAVAYSLMETGSSIFPERTSFARSIVQLPMRRLDDAVAKHELTGSILMKMDVQGAELEVLCGGPLTLSRSEAVLMEVSLLPYNEGAPKLIEVFIFMNANGFVLYDICGILRRKSDSAAFQADLLFVRENHRLRSEKAFW